jgi:hypothetical protein
MKGLAVKRHFRPLIAVVALGVGMAIPSASTPAQADDGCPRVETPAGGTCLSQPQMGSLSCDTFTLDGFDGEVKACVYSILRAVDGIIHGVLQ